MNAENMWEAFAKQNNLTEQTYEAWAFGAQADELAELVKREKKQQLLLLILCMSWEETRSQRRVNTV